MTIYFEEKERAVAEVAALRAAAEEQRVHAASQREAAALAATIAMDAERDTQLVAQQRQHEEHAQEIAALREEQNLLVGAVDTRAAEVATLEAAVEAATREVGQLRGALDAKQRNVARVEADLHLKTVEFLSTKAQMRSALEVSHASLASAKSALLQAQREATVRKFHRALTHKVRFDDRSLRATRTLPSRLRACVVLGTRASSLSLPSLLSLLSLSLSFPLHRQSRGTSKQRTKHTHSLNDFFDVSDSGGQWRR